MEKKIDLSRSVYELVSAFPELLDILYNLGFTGLKDPQLFNSVAKLMTIPKGAKMQNIPMEKVIFALMSNGFTLEGKMPSSENQEEKKEPVVEEKEEEQEEEGYTLSERLRKRRNDFLNKKHKVS